VSANEPLDPSLGNSSFAGKFGEEVAEQFGANEWLVDEMYERYQKDSSSVDQTWRDFFAKFGPSSQSGSAVAAPVAQRPSMPPTPKSATTQPVVPERTLIQSAPQITEGTPIRSGYPYAR
jgi:2-oxoglutarate decarboxylase